MPLPTPKKNNYDTIHDDQDPGELSDDPDPRMKIPPRAKMSKVKMTIPPLGSLFAYGQIQEKGDKDLPDLEDQVSTLPAALQSLKSVISTITEFNGKIAHGSEDNHWYQQVLESTYLDTDGNAQVIPGNAGDVAALKKLHKNPNVQNYLKERILPALEGIDDAHTLIAHLYQLVDRLARVTDVVVTQNQSLSERIDAVEKAIKTGGAGVSAEELKTAVKRGIEEVYGEGLVGEKLGEKKRSRRTGKGRDNLMECVIHWAFHEAHGKYFKQSVVNPKYTVEYTYHVKHENQNWLGHEEGGESGSITIDLGGGNDNGENIKLEFRPDWDDKEHEHSKKFLEIVFELARAQLLPKDGDNDTTPGHYSDAEILLAADTYWFNTAKTIKESKDSDVVKQKEREKQLKRRADRSTTVAKYRNEHFKNSPLQSLNNAPDYQLLLQAECIPEFLSDDEEDGRYATKRVGGELYREFDSYRRMTFPEDEGMVPRHWEYKGKWWLSEEFFFASIVLDSFCEIKNNKGSAGKKKAGSNLNASEIWYSAREKARPTLSPPYPDIRSKVPGSLDKPIPNTAGAIITKPMVNQSAIDDYKGFSDKLFPALSKPFDVDVQMTEGDLEEEDQLQPKLTPGHQEILDALNQPGNELLKTMVVKTMDKFKIPIDWEEESTRMAQALYATRLAKFQAGLISTRPTDPFVDPALGGN